MAFSSYWVDDPDHDIEHYGVKGMKWGVRKKRQTSTKNKRPRQRLILESKTKNGAKILGVQAKGNRIANFLARHNVNLQKQIEATKNLELYDANSKKIGNLQLFHESPTSLNVTWLGINERDRGKGYAQAAMHMAEDYARKSGMKQLTLEVPGISPEARHIYEKQGFKAVGSISDKDDIWGGLTAMKKQLQ